MAPVLLSLQSKPTSVGFLAVERNVFCGLSYDLTCHSHGIARGGSFHSRFYRESDPRRRAILIRCSGSSTRGGRGFQPIFHLLMLHQPRLLHHRTASVEDNEIWDAAHLESCSNLRVAFRVEFYDHRSSRHISSGTRNFRSCHAARSAP